MPFSDRPAILEAALSLPGYIQTYAINQCKICNGGGGHKFNKIEIESIVNILSN